MGSVIAHAVAALKRLIRPLVPDALVARFRTPVRPGWARTNVDLFVADDGENWARSTPDTWRVIATDPHTSAATEGIPVGAAVGEVVGDADETQRLMLLQVLASANYSTVFLARTNPPPVNRGSYAAPVIEPLAMASAEPSESGPSESGPSESGPSESGPSESGTDLAGALHRRLNEGQPIAIVPAGPAGATRMPLSQEPITSEVSVVVMAGVPLHDVGGGFRGAQLARELARRGAAVTYVHEFDSGESVDLGLRISHPRLEEVRSEWFDPAQFVDRVDSSTRIVLVEFPHKDIVEAALALRATGGYQIVYDLIDDWSDRALGGMWWAAEYEDALFAAADAVVASAPSLVRRAQELDARHQPLLVPNGFNEAVFRSAIAAPAPVDIPSGTGPIFTYHGSLYGDWIDWQAIEGVAREWPEARLIMIGDERDHPTMPDNVHFLGLKPQSELESYLAQADVSLIPFKVNATTHAVSPLKAFEAMAVGVPVAAPPLETLADLDGIYTDHNLVAAVNNALTAPPLDPAAARKAHSWRARVNDLLDGLGIEAELTDDVEPQVHLRPPTTYSDGERRIGFS